MAEFSIIEAVEAGPRLIARQPLSVLVWGVLPTLAFVPLLLLFGGTIFAVVTQIAHAGGASSERVAAVLSAIGALLLFLLVAVLVAWVVGAVTTAAAYRAVLHPDRSAFFYLRLGAEEWSLMLVGLALFGVFFGVGVALAIPTSIITLATVGSTASVRLTILALVSLARYAVTVWIWLRLSMATPMTFAERRFHLFESWSLTRGHTLQILAVGVLVVLIMAAVEFVAALLGLSGLFLVGGAVAAVRANPQALLANPQAILSMFGPVLIVWIVLYALVAGIARAVLRAPLAHIYRALNGPDVAAAFS